MTTKFDKINCIQNISNSCNIYRYSTNENSFIKSSYVKSSAIYMKEVVIVANLLEENEIDFILDENYDIKIVS
jgi:hypothetical protein